MDIINKCSKGIDEDNLLKDFDASCKGKPSCKFNLKKYIIDSKKMGESYPR